MTSPASNKGVSKKWFMNGKLHRTDGPAIIYVDGEQAWYINGKRHRTDGPAVVGALGQQYWFMNGKIHRIDGPSVIYADGEKSWYFNGHRITNESDIELFTGKENDLIILILKYGSVE